jgi:hypothetical protein
MFHSLNLAVRVGSIPPRAQRTPIPGFASGSFQMNGTWNPNGADNEGGDLDITVTRYFKNPKGLFD